MSHPDGTVPGTFDDTPFRVEWTPDGHVTEESVHAWLDGALDDDDQQAVDGHVQSCAACAAAVAEARGYIAASVRIVLSADLASDRGAHGSAADSPVLATAPPLPSVTGRTATPRTPRWFARSAVRVAAAVCVMVAGAGYLASREARRPAPPASPAPAPSAIVASAERPAVTTPSRPAPRAVGVAGERVAPPREAAGVTGEVVSAPPAPSPTPTLAPAAEAATEGLRARLTRTITGRVLDGGVPVAGASVLIAGTTVGTLSDSLGRYTLRAVPDTAATLVARRIGYVATSLPLADVISDSAPVNIQLTASTYSLSSVVVTSALPSEELLRAPCLVAQWPSTSGERPLLRMLRGTVRAAGTLSLDVVGWPDSTSRTRGTFVLDSAGNLSGSASSGEARVAFSLRSFDDSWEGTVTESRGEATRVEEVSFVPEASAEQCTRRQ